MLMLAGRMDLMVARVGLNHLDYFYRKTKRMVGVDELAE